MQLSYEQMIEQCKNIITSINITRLISTKEPLVYPCDDCAKTISHFCDCVAIRLTNNTTTLFMCVPCAKGSIRRSSILFSSLKSSLMSHYTSVSWSSRVPTNRFVCVICVTEDDVRYVWSADNLLTPMCKSCFIAIKMRRLLTYQLVRHAFNEYLLHDLIEVYMYIDVRC